MGKLGKACDKMSLEINIGKSKVVNKDQGANIERLEVNGEELEEVVKFKYLRGMVSADGIREKEMTHRLHEGGKDDILRNKMGVVLNCCDINSSFWF